MKLLITLILLLSVSAHADILFLNDGSELRGKITKINDNAVTLEKDGKPEVHKLKDVLKVQVLSEKKIEGEETVAQIKDERLKRYIKNPPDAAAFPGAGHIVLFHETKHELHKDGSSSHIVHEAKLLLKERGLGQANVNFSFRTPFEKGEILWARSIHKGKIYNLDDTSIKEASNYSQFPTYDRERSIKFSIPNALEGTIIDYAYKITCKKHSDEHPFGGEALFQTSHPILLDELHVTVPQGKELHWSVLNSQKKLQKTKEKDGRTTYTYSAKEIKPRRPEVLTAPWWRDRPTVIYSTGSGWHALTENYKEEVERARVIPKDLARQTAKLVKGCSGEQKLRRLFEFVLREIKLIRVGANHYGPMPKAASAIYKGRRGNFLDKAFFLYALLRHHKIQSDFALAMSKHSSTVLDNVPSLKSFFGGFVVLPSGKLLFPYGDTSTQEDIPEAVQGTRGLLVTSEDKEKTFVDIPLLPADREELKTVKTVTLKGDTFHINEVFTATGITQQYYRSFKDLPKLALDKVAENLVGRIDSKASLKSYEFINLKSLTEPLQVKLNYTIASAVIEGGEKIRCFTIPGLYFTEDRSASKSKRENLMFYSRRKGLDVTFTCRFPSGFKLYHHPKTLEVDNKFYTFTARYVPVKNGLSFRFRFARKAVEIETKEYAAYRAGLVKIRNYLNQYVVIER